MKQFRLDGKHVVITGASAGIGHHFAGVISGAGARVSLGARRLDKIVERAEALNAAGAEAMGAALDVCDPHSVEAFINTAEKQFGPIDVLINNAGISINANSFLDLDENGWDLVLDTNLKSAWRLSKIFTQRLIHHKKSEGNIIMVSSITDRRTTKGQFAYTVSKAGITRMTETLALEAAQYGIRVNALAPGYVITDLNRDLLGDNRKPDFMKKIPMRRYGEPDDLAGPLLLLASDASRYMTGSVITVDGGHVCSSL